MEVKNIFGDVLFALEGAKTILEVVNAAAAAKKSLSHANLVGASLDGASLDRASLDGASLVGASLVGASLVGARLDRANLVGASLDSANLVGASLVGKLISALRVFGGLYDYQVWAVLFQDGTRQVCMGCLFYEIDKWETIDIRKSNLSEFTDDGSERSENRVAAFEFAKAAALRMAVKP